MKMGRVDFQGEVNRGCRGHGGINKGKDGNGVKHNEGEKSNMVIDSERQQRR